MQSDIKNLAQGPRNFDELNILICSESAVVKQHIRDEIQKYESVLAHKAYCKRFLESLWYPEKIRRRQEAIKDAHERTFQWIFEPEERSKEVNRWTNLPQWLESGHGTYWINSKAGSGKSTLVNYIVQDDRTLEALKVCSGAKELLLPSFSFWNAGSVMEKGSERISLRIGYCVTLQ